MITKTNRQNVLYLFQDNLPYMKPRSEEQNASSASVDSVDHGDTSAVMKSSESTANKKTSITGTKRTADLPAAVDDASLAETLRLNQLLEEERQREAERNTLEGKRRKQALEEHEALMEAKKLAKQKEEERLAAWEKRIIEERKVTKSHIAYVL